MANPSVSVVSFLFFFFFCSLAFCFCLKSSHRSTRVNRDELKSYRMHTVLVMIAAFSSLTLTSESRLARALRVGRLCEFLGSCSEIAAFLILRLEGLSI